MVATSYFAESALLFLISRPPAMPTPADEAVAPVSRPAVVRASSPAHEDFRSTLFLIGRPQAMPTPTDETA
jgi:hypothetical protein